MKRPVSLFIVIRVNDTDHGWAVADRATGQVVKIAGGKVEGVTKDVAEAMAATLEAAQTR